MKASLKQGNRFKICNLLLRTIKVLLFIVLDEEGGTVARGQAIFGKIAPKRISVVAAILMTQLIERNIM